MDSERQSFEDNYGVQILERLDQLISATLNNHSRPALDLKITLWNTAQVAEYVGRTYKYTCEFIVTHHTFPDSMRIAIGDSKKGHPRWYAAEVIEWVAGFKEGNN